MIRRWENVSKMIKIEGKIKKRSEYQYEGEEGGTGQPARCS